MSGTTGRNRRLYDRLAPIYDLAARLPSIARPRTRLFMLADIRPGDRVLLVGVGTGLDLDYLPRGALVTGIDLSPAMLARARTRHPEATLLEMDAESLGFGAASFDVVILSYVLSVVADPHRVLAEAARVLVPEGEIWVLGKFSEGAPGLLRRLSSALLTLLGGARLTLSLHELTTGTRLAIHHRESSSLLADICELTLLPGPSEASPPSRG